MGIGGSLTAPADTQSELPDVLRELGGVLVGQIAGLDARIGALDRDPLPQARQHPDARRPMTIPGVGPARPRAGRGTR